MQPIIKIGLTYTGTEEKHNNYVNWLKGNDNIEIIKLSAADNNLEQVKDVDAIVLSGGVDAHPKTYGSSNMNYPNAPATFNEQRDTFETAVFDICQRQNKPVLAICRGMQLVNCLLGGDMVQDIGPVANAIHKNDGNDKKHAVQILPGSLLNEITRIAEDDINSAHHQAIDKTGKGLTVNAISKDGIREGIEWADKTGKPFFLGIQWHPERMYKFDLQASPLSKNIRDYFINEIKKTNIS
jgi:putative glutamine amidotransferase